MNHMKQDSPFDNEEPLIFGGKLDNTKKVTRDGFWIGCHHAMSDEMVDYVVECFANLKKEYRKHARAS